MAIAIVAGAMANKPFSGGEAWVRLSWLLGLERLGFEVFFVEQIDSATCVDDAGERAPFATSANRAHFDAVTRDFGFGDRCSLLCDGGAETSGIGVAELRELVRDAELLFDISGHLRLAELREPPRTSVYVDLDPGFTQGWHADPAIDFRLGGHDRHVTVGLNVGDPDCRVAETGIDWLPTLPPVVLEQWPAHAPEPGRTRFTTVATWRSPSGTLVVDGAPATLKHHELRRLLELPERVPEATFEIALDIHPADAADRDALEQHGWRIADPRDVAATPSRFRDYVQRSAAEFSVAQGVYVATRSGWFSDRSAAYLASGRPALVQDTGAAARLEPGDGLSTFTTLDEAAERAAEIAAAPAGRGAAARAFAERRLDSDVVLGDLLSRLGVGG